MQTHLSPPPHLAPNTHACVDTRYLRLLLHHRLRDDDRKDPAVLSYLKAENTYTTAAMADTEAVQAELYREMRGRIKEEDTSTATRWGVQGFLDLRTIMCPMDIGIHDSRYNHTVSQ